MPLNQWLSRVNGIRVLIEVLIKAPILPIDGMPPILTTSVFGSQHIRCCCNPEKKDDDFCAEAEDGSDGAAAGEGVAFEVRGDDSMERQGESKD